MWPLLAGTSTALDSQRRPSSMHNPSESLYMNGKVGRRSREQGRDERAAAGPLIGALESSADSLLAIRAMKKSGWNPTTRQGGKSRNPVNAISLRSAPGGRPHGRQSPPTPSIFSTPYGNLLPHPPSFESLDTALTRFDACPSRGDRPEWALWGHEHAPGRCRLLDPHSKRDPRSS